MSASGGEGEGEEGGREVSNVCPEVSGEVISDVCPGSEMEISDIYPKHGTDLG